MLLYYQLLLLQVAELEPLLTQLGSLPIELGQVVVFGIDNKHRLQGLKSQKF